jgi:membrane protein DedA with SNARE-associated domain
MERWITHLIESGGAFSVGLLMFIENIAVLLPSELIMPLAGYYAALGELSFWRAVISGTIGAHLGSLIWYWLGRTVSKQRFERLVRRHGIWLGLETRQVQRASRWFDRHGALAVITGRLIPAIRTFISIPAGFNEMPLVTFVPLSLAGSFLFNAALAEGGKLLGVHFREIHRWIQPITIAVISVMFLWWLIRVIRMMRAHH